MLIKELFFTINQMVDQIAARLPIHSNEERAQIEKQVLELKKLGDTILDEWINFEEGMIDKIGPYFPALLNDSVLTEFQSQTAHPDIKEREEIPAFFKAKGYFDLGIYQESYPLLKEVVHQEPDHEFARLYFAYSAIFLGKKEEAVKHFTLLEKTTSSPKVRAVCLNALGILNFDDGKFETAGTFFEQAIEWDHGLFVAYYNLGMVCFAQRRFNEAIQHWEEYLILTHDHDLELIFNLSNAYLKLGQYQKTIQLWKKHASENQEQILFQLGHFFEDAHQYEEAIACYKNILMRKPNEAEALHGYGWNLWLHTNDPDMALPLLKKALSLEPHNLNFAFSLSWIYFHLNYTDEVERAVNWILQQDDRFPLALSLSFLISVKKGDLKRAEEWTEKLREQKPDHHRALGELFLGRLRLTQNHLQEAIQSFRRSVWNNPHLRESYLLQGLAYYLNQEIEKAEEIWKKHHFISS